MVNKFLSSKFWSYATSLFILCLFFSAIQVSAQVTVDSRSAGGAFKSAGVASLSWTHTIGTGSDRAIFVGISTTSQVASLPVCIPNPCPSIQPLPSIGLGGDPTPVLTVKYNGISMQKVEYAPALDRQVSIYWLVTPPTGTHNIDVTFTPGVVTHAVGTSVSFKGVNQINPFTNTTFTSNVSGIPTNTPSISVSGTGVTTNDMVFDTLVSTPNAGYFTAGFGQIVCTDSTENTCTRGRRFFYYAYDVGASSTKAASPTGTTMNWTMATASPWILMATVVKASPPPTASPASIEGQIRTVDEEPISNVLVVLQNLQSGEEYKTFTGKSGGYYFENLDEAQLYLIKVFRFGYNFSPDSQILNLTESHDSIDFIGTPRNRKPAATKAEF